MLNYLKNFGFVNYEFQIVDYFIVIIGSLVFIAVIIVACVCFPPYRSDEEWERIENEADEREKKRQKEKKQKEEQEEKNKETDDKKDGADMEAGEMMGAPE